MASTEVIAYVELEGETFDLYKSPTKESQLVKERIQSITKDVDFDLITTQTSSLSLSLRVAYLGVSKFPLLQIKVNELSLSITRLSDESVRVLQRFQRAAVSITQSYISATKYFEKQKEKFAIMELGNVFTKAEEMKDAVADLASKYGKSSEEATKIYEAVQREIKVRDDATGEVNRLGKELEEIEKSIEKTEKEVTQAQEREDEARNRMNSASLGRKIVKAIIRNTDEEREFETYYTERVKIQDKLRNLRIEYQSKMLEKLKEASKLKPHENTEIVLEKSTLCALDCCVKGMRHAQATLESVTQFWRQVSDVNKDFSGKNVKEHVELIQDDENPAEMFNEEGFRRKIKLEQITWVAMGIASHLCMESISGSNRELHLFLGEHYPPDQAMQKLQELMSEFTKRTEDVYKAMKKPLSIEQ